MGIAQKSPGRIPHCPDAVMRRIGARVRYGDDPHLRAPTPLGGMERASCRPAARDGQRRDHRWSSPCLRQCQRIYDSTVLRRRPSERAAGIAQNYMSAGVESRRRPWSASPCREPKAPAQTRNRISSSGRGRPDRFRLDQDRWPVPAERRPRRRPAAQAATLIHDLPDLDQRPLSRPGRVDPARASGLRKGAATGCQLPSDPAPEVLGLRDPPDGCVEQHVPALPADFLAAPH
jgi:hypothetical protein